jgi:hypothetical protein
MKLVINSLFFLFGSAEKLQNVVSNKNRQNVQDEDISLYAQLILFVVIFLIVFTILLYLMDQWSKHWDFLKKLKGVLKKNYFIFFFLFPAFYLIYYYSYYLPQKNTESYWVRPETVDFLLKASLTFLGTGVLTGGLKWLNNLAFFKKQFSDLIKSEDFSNVLSQKMKELALSDNYLLQRNDLEEIWKRVTICKYEQKFPELGEEIQEKVENDLYVDKYLDYYYKNFRMQINLSLDGDVVKIIEISSFTIVSHSENEIEVDFGTTSPVEDTELIYSRLNGEECRCDGEKLIFKTDKNKNERGEDIPKTTHFTTKLSGKKKYVIERQIEMTQDLKDDRVYSFASSRIIEGLSINIKPDEKLDIFFSAVGKNIFHLDNQMRSGNSTGYITRELLLSGEKFKIFIFKKN